MEEGAKAITADLVEPQSELEITEWSANSKPKSLANTDSNGAKKNVKDIVFWGDGDTFKLISKASSEAEGWMKSTKAMQLPTGCVIQVTTQQGDNVAEALTFVPGAKLFETKDTSGVVVGRYFK